MNVRTAPATVALGVGGLLLLAAVSWVFVLNPKLGALSEASEQSTALQDSNLAMAGQLNTLRAMAEDVPTMKGAADELTAVVPPTADQPGFFRAITQAADDAGLPASALTSVSPGVPVLPAAPAAPAPPVAAEGAEEGAAAAPAAAPEPQVAVQVVSININGSYDQLRKFLGNLESMERAVLVQSINLSASETSLSLTVTGSTFVAPPLGDPPTGTS